MEKPMQSIGNAQLLTRLGRDIERIQQVEFQLKTARDVQRRLLNSCLPAIEGLDYYGECRSRGAVAGDFFDLAGAAGSLIVCVGDVSKTGIPAAIIVAALQATVRALPWTGQKPIYWSAAQLNQLVCQIAPESFYASMFLGRIDPERRRLQYVNAGRATAMLVRHKTNRLVELEGNGPALGLRDSSAFQQRSIQFEPGDTFVALTAGIVDAMDVEGHGNHEQIVLEAIRDHRNACSADLADEILDAADRSTNGFSSSDDKTVVVIRFPGPPMTIVVDDSAVECAALDSLCACAV
jgi:phosphoserine phosphatase RsbU/P